MKKIFTMVYMLSIATAYAQQQSQTTDTTKIISLQNVTSISKQLAADASYLDDVTGTSIYAGKHTNSLLLTNNTGGLPINLSRTAFAKIPGLTMWDMDGAGTQLNIASRGTDPHRSIEMNMRQNGYNTNSDMFGYPENHYSIPLQAVDEIQLIRGSGALQFGPQFGGMLNYKLKRGDTTKPFVIESEQTIGGNNFFNSFNAIGGTKGKLNYYAYYDHRHGDGWRKNAAFNYAAFYVHADYQVNSKLNIAVEFSRMRYVQQIAGGLTDAQFQKDAQHSERARNYFEPFINIPAVLLKYQVSASTKLEITSSGIIGQRNSVQFINAGNIPDTFNTSIGSYNPRQLDRDYYYGFTTEARLLHRYKFGNNAAVLTSGLRYFYEHTQRKQKGMGTTGSDFDLALIKPYGTDLRLITHNYAAFAENTFYLGKHLSVTPGVRYEVIKTDLTGVITNATVNVNYKGNRNFPLFGTGVQYQLNTATQLYGNFSQAYRPYLYANVTPADRLDKIDPDLKDSKGYNIDFGYRGHYKKIFQFDINAFYLFYGDKIGLLSQSNINGGTSLLTTNIGDAVAKGVDVFAELSLLKLFSQRAGKTDLKLFNSLGYNHARYKKGIINKGGINTSIDNNFVENAPQWNNKTGLEFSTNRFSTTLQYSYTSKYFNDALNTVSSTNGVLGVIPSYHLLDWNATWQFKKGYHLSASVNNIADKRYFNRRITMYPGPGILPADGRTFYISAGIKL